ncbi:hypothetical protein [Shewanella sedimentimangrovi]|uniref:Uncharacterized protein n=1 Tax=Shewanella sedimentimangrovi TaxID=2814293 RepID=A0ABX7R574_9GAMM|nr:hypothetical protein [Shewanella sedimentimangrovi]QSX38422.1 hypothetical protein JYB85_06265 [Shewanella sedimentimangrovi]
MKLIPKYLTIPIIFGLLVAGYALITGNENQASFIGLFIYGVLFYGAPYFLHSMFMVLFKASNQAIHAGFIGITLALVLISSMWLLPQDPSGLPIQWMGYWPLSVILGLVFIGGSIAVRKYKNS